MAAPTLSSLSSEILDSVDCTSSGWPTTANLTLKINRALAELYDLLVTQHQNYFIERATITTSTAVDYISVPDGWYPQGKSACYKVLRLLYPYSSTMTDLEPMTQSEYADMVTSNSSIVSAGEDLRWIQLGNQIVFQGTPSSAVDLQLWYVPQCPQLSTLLLSDGEAFDTANWTKLDTARDVVKPHYLANPVNGKYNADALIGFTTSGAHGVTQAPTLTAAPYNLSVFLKAGAKTYAYLSSSVGSVSCYFNLSAGTVGTAANCVGNIVSWGNGWYRCDIKFTGTAAAHTLSILPAASGSSTTYAGDASTIDLYMFGAQLIQDYKPSSYWELTDKIDWLLPFNWTDYIVFHVCAQLMAREESDYNYWMAMLERSKQAIIGAAHTRDLGHAIRVSRTYNRGRH